MTYKVIKSFTDLQDDNYLYKVGDTYPRKSYNTSPERLAELSTSANRRGEALIKEIKETKRKKIQKKN